jgi:hypothetical protein
VLNGTGKVYAVPDSLSGVGPSGDQPIKSSNSAGFIPTLPRVTKPKRRVASVELVFSDDPIPNSDHPLASLSPLDRHRLGFSSWQRSSLRLLRVGQHG